jgi:hypothetical protein
LFVRAVESTVEPQSDAYYAALAGDAYLGGETGGCEAEFERRLTEGVTMLSVERNAISNKTQEERNEAVKLSETVAEASERWSECMADNGYRYADPHLALSDFLTVVEREDGGREMAWENGVATEEEKRVAVQDATCKESTAFWDAVKSARRDAESQIAVAMKTQLEEVRESREREMENAQEILTSADVQ